MNWLINHINASGTANNGLETKVHSTKTYFISNKFVSIRNNNCLRLHFFTFDTFKQPEDLLNNSVNIPLR